MDAVSAASAPPGQSGAFLARHPAGGGTDRAANGPDSGVHLLVGRDATSTSGGRGGDDDGSDGHVLWDLSGVFGRADARCNFGQAGAPGADAVSGGGAVCYSGELWD